MEVTERNAVCCGAGREREMRMWYVVCGEVERNCGGECCGGGGDG